MGDATHTITSGVAAVGSEDATVECYAGGELARELG